MGGRDFQLSGSWAWQWIFANAERAPSGSLRVCLGLCTPGWLLGVANHFRWVYAAKHVTQAAIFSHPARRHLPL